MNKSVTFGQKVLNLADVCKSILTFGKEFYPDFDIKLKEVQNYISLITKIINERRSQEKTIDTWTNIIMPHVKLLRNGDTSVMSRVQPIVLNGASNTCYKIDVGFCYQYCIENLKEIDDTVNKSISLMLNNLQAAFMELVFRVDIEGHNCYKMLASEPNIDDICNQIHDAFSQFQGVEELGPLANLSNSISKDKLSSLVKLTVGAMNKRGPNGEQVGINEAMGDVIGAMKNMRIDKSS